MDDVISSMRRITITMVYNGLQCYIGEDLEWDTYSRLGYIDVRISQSRVVKINSA